MALEFALEAEVTKVGSAKAAFSHLDDHPIPDLIILDVMMPEIDGYSACKTLRERGDCNGVPIVFLTARVGSVEQQKCDDAGGTAFLAKPFDPMTIGDQLRSVLADAGHQL